MYVPFNVANYKMSAHFLEIDKIVFSELWRKFEPIKEEINLEFNRASEKERRTKYLGNPNYVYEPFGWEQ
jgi:predicted membrane protein